MSIVTVEGLAKSYGAQDVFADVSFAIARGDKIALVGPNGAGKTTLLRILVGLEEPTDGRVHRARGLRSGYLPQRPSLDSQRTLHGEMLEVLSALRRQQQDLLALAHEMAQADDPTEAMARYAEAEQRFELAGGYEYENRIQRVLSGLGFGPESYEQPITILSGGQVTRAMLARLLLQEPDLLVLDEPTNYLDLEALEWLEGYLQDWRQSLLVVSHDRYFLNKVVSRVWELSWGALETYRGNYDGYVQQREALLERRRREYEEQQATIAKTEEFVRRFKAGQRSKEARGRETRLARLERVEAPKTRRQMHLRLSTSLRAGDNVLRSDGAAIGYRETPESEDGCQAAGGTPHVLFQTGEFLMQRGQRVALLGPNGSGKTTFLRAVLGQTEPLEGRIRIGASVRVGYLPQTQDWLDGDKTVLEQVFAVTDLRLEQARALLGRFLFTADDVDKPISALSGGERSRLALALLTVRGANLLLLDEPTTHLDLESQEVLQRVLSDFPGTILFVSHDRYLVDALASHVWVIREGRMRRFTGGYSAYLQALEAERTAGDQPSRERRQPDERQEARRRERRQERDERRRAERAHELEREISDLEEALAQLTDGIETASAARDVERVQALSEEYRHTEGRLTERLHEWEACASAAEVE